MKFNYVKKYPATAYFILTFLISWSGAFILVAPELLKRKPITTLDGILMFPIMLIGPPVASLILTSVTGGKPALRNLGRHLRTWAPVKWFLLPLLIFPCLILTTLLLLHFVSPVFAPNFFSIGFLFGIPAGILEEIGWTGFAFRALHEKKGFFKSAVILGMIWALWHLSAIDFLGAARPHGQWLPLFFLSFAALLVGVRLLIAWMYTCTGSIPLAQFTHAVSTGCLVTFGAAHITPAQEALWYGVYALLLWIVVMTILRIKKNIAFHTSQ
jgi:membrane protease YdiL (CAAX protease family)